MPQSTLYKAMRLANLAGKKAHFFRQSDTQHAELRQRSSDWSGIFDPGLVLTSGIAFFGLAVVDCCLMMPMYRQASEITLGEPDMINLELAVGMVCLGAVCSNFLAQTHTSGPFYQWRIHQHRGGLAALEFDYNRLAGWLHFGLTFSCYCLILGAMAWIRATLIADSGLSIEKIETGFILTGILVSFCAIVCGQYLAPMIDYLSMKMQLSILSTRKNSLLHDVMRADQFVYLVWAHHGSATNLPREMYDAIIRHKIRPANEAYCNEITLAEEQAFQNNRHIN
ncbi:MAG TPA: hypothetical protein PLO67_15805 [Saprospiraceae bacterium]|nr:hypothetical protein [Saprospiraceae bacterium]HPI07785.1 hypothetical protein [Saprospiraceae bacterium]